MAVCECRRVLRLDLPAGDSVWICAVCNARFIPKAAVEYKIQSLAGTLMTLIEKEVVTVEQVKGVWFQETLPFSP